MTRQEATALAHRAVACPRWRWMPGMYVIEERNGAASRYFHGNGPVNTCTDDGGWMRFSSFAGLLPDLTDPATLGCLLALVREAYNDPFAHVEYELGEWIVWATPEGRRGKYSMSVRKTEAEALVRALERAP